MCADYRKTYPAGLGAAFALLESHPDIHILLLDAAQVSSGGLRNDCKMNFTFPVSRENDYFRGKKYDFF